MRITQQDLTNYFNTAFGGLLYKRSKNALAKYENLAFKDTLH